MRLRLGEPSPRKGETVDVGITPMRSLVLEPTQSGRMYLAGDAAHIVSPTGAKGMNLALADVTVLARAIVEWQWTGSSAGLDSYSADRAARIWRAQRFSSFMTNLSISPATPTPSSTGSATPISITQTGRGPRRLPWPREPRRRGDRPRRVSTVTTSNSYAAAAPLSRTANAHRRRPRGLRICDPQRIVCAAAIPKSLNKPCMPTRRCS